ncbi:MAG: prephenate dehydrogenase/arogenate dehydrogenase family protein [bacterium]|nr:prephenate dehydrogenase/arogenate dehydrogenase family protein [bacterium]
MTAGGSARLPRLVVAGVGLIGGSFALAARAADLVGEIVGIGRTRRNLEEALRRGIIDRIAIDAADAARDADVFLLAAPVGACAALAAELRPHARPDAILTDAGSTKAGLVAALEAAWTSPALVVGAHPIAGSETSGAGAARADLYRGRPCILTPTAATDPGALARVRALWEGVGARVTEMDAGRHDAILARVSHVPHLVAYALVLAATEGAVPADELLAWAGAGFRDTTRIAASPAELWRDIALANAAAVCAGLAEFRAALARIERCVAQGDAAGLEAALAVAARARRGLGGGGA